MSDMNHIDNELLVAYLYDEVDAPARTQIERHLRACATCVGELGALEGVRTTLKTWTPPAIDLGFTVVSRSAGPAPATVLRPAQWWNTVPVWAQAVAAILVLAVAAGAANIQVRSGPDGFSVTTGWMQDPALSAPSEREAIGREVEGWKPALTALEAQLRNEIRSTRAGVSAAPVAVRSTSDEAILRRVQDLLADSEKRQQRELALRLTQFNQDTNIQRQADLVKIQKLFGENNERISQQGEVLNYMIRASGRPQQ
jgi:hypothetical protein